MYWPLEQNSLYGPSHETSVLIAYAQKPTLNTHADIFSEACGLKFGLSLHLYPYIVYANIKGTGQSVHLHRSPPVLSLLHNAISTKISCAV